jgi:hypothetical protein
MDGIIKKLDDLIRPSVVFDHTPSVKTARSRMIVPIESHTLK